jgi:hypothetical protein
MSASPRHVTIGGVNVAEQFGGINVRLISKPDRGRCVLAARDFVEDQLILCEPALIVPSDQVELLDKTIVGRYYCYWPTPKREKNHAAAIVFGMFSLLNHDRNANCYAQPRGQSSNLGPIVSLFASRKIAFGEELTIDYGLRKDEYEYYGIPRK